MGYLNMSSKLWQTQTSGDSLAIVESYTVGNDYILDQELLGYDIQASKAHGQMLNKIGILKDEETTKLVAELDALYKLWQAGKFKVEKHQEDGHTAIEAYLTEKLGDIGKKIHTARSRNDQSLVMMRLYLKDNLAKLSQKTEILAKTYAQAAKEAGDTPMPGYTHMQKAMPTSVAMWLNSFADGFLDASKLIRNTLPIIDQNPLGSAAGFGISLPIDRDFTSKKLGFSKTQQNPMYCGISRGLFELIAVQSLTPVMILAGKFAHDMLIFTTQEFDYFSLPDEFTTGSSIMPQKHNYDMFEIMRAKAHLFVSYPQQLNSVVSSIGSGYQRDLQLTKQITMDAFYSAESTVEMLNTAVAKLQINHDKLEGSISSEMLSVAAINDLVNQGVPFRDAYAQVKAGLEQARRANK